MASVSLARIPTFAVSAYIIALALIQQIGFWNSFDVNILQYATLTDMAKYSVWPLLSVGTLLALSIVTQGMAFFAREEWKRAVDADEAPPVGVRGFIRRHFLVLVLLLLLGGAVSAASFDEPNGWSALAVALGLNVYAASLVVKFDPLKKFVRDDVTRKLVTFFLLIAPFAMWGIGKQRAADITAGRQYAEATVPLDVLTQSGLEARQELRYLGSTADYSLFLLHPQEVVWILRNDSFTAMTLRMHKLETKPFWKR